MRSERRNSGTITGEKLSIGLLFVDDESSIRLTLPPILEEQGFQVEVADDVPSALQQISSHRFDVILTDLNITESRDGFAVVKAARAANPLCVAIVLTGYPDFESAVEAINCGVDNYLVKPADVETLVATIRQRLSTKASLVRHNSDMRPRPAKASENNPRD